jgi:hypothetical protein
MTLALAAAACAFVVMTTPALAHQFVASRIGNTKGIGFKELELPERGVEPKFEPSRMQEFILGRFKILCYRARSKGVVTALESEMFETTIHFTHCGEYPWNTSLHYPASFSKEGLTLVYHANGYAEAEEDGSGEEVGVKEDKEVVLRPLAAAIKLPNAHLCQIDIPEQTIPARAVAHPTEEFSSAVYTNTETPIVSKKFPTGFQKKLIIANEFKGIKFAYGGEETQCETANEKLEEQNAENGGTTGGRYAGTLIEEVTGGNLSRE